MWCAQTAQETGGSLLVHLFQESKHLATVIPGIMRLCIHTAKNLHRFPIVMARTALASKPLTANTGGTTSQCPSKGPLPFTSPW